MLQPLPLEVYWRDAWWYCEVSRLNVEFKTIQVKIQLLEKALLLHKWVDELHGLYQN
jgi:hypothetical protein